MNFMSGFSEDHHHQITGMPCSSSSSSPTTLHRFNVGDSSQTEKEHMFDKVVTPSDVGKLNRLVIPKQHAEKYFPLDSSANEKGLLLNFEDSNGKPWRFRYSYWNSSQSYVMTKGWSRFVKEKKLDAGDIVSFQRGLGEIGKDRLFIDWRRRPDAAPELLFSTQIPTNQFSLQRSVNPWNPLFFQPTPSSEYSNFLPGNGPCYYNTTVVNGNPCPSGSILYLRSAPGAGGVGLFGPQQVGVTQRRSEMVFESVPVVQGKAAAKRMRLFGVNMDCPVVSDSDDHQCDDMLTHPNFDSSSSTCSSPTIPSLLKLRPYNNQKGGDKGKGSMSLDLDI